jgi:hypothetical protein
MKRMRYECPKCGSMKKPKVVNYFPPVIVLCVDCNYKSIEANFIKKEGKNFTPLPLGEHKI